MSGSAMKESTYIWHVCGACLRSNVGWWTKLCCGLGLHPHASRRCGDYGQPFSLAELETLLRGEPLLVVEEENKKRGYDIKRICGKADSCKERKFSAGIGLANIQSGELNSRTRLWRYR